VFSERGSQDLSNDTYGKGNRIPSGICWGSSEFLLHPIVGANVRDAPLLTAGFEAHPRRRGNSLPVSRSACVVSSYASRFRTNTTYQPHMSPLNSPTFFHCRIYSLCVAAGPPYLYNTLAEDEAIITRARILFIRTCQQARDSFALNVLISLVGAVVIPI
jgi:hypothetical protein